MIYIRIGVRRRVLLRNKMRSEIAISLMYSVITSYQISIMGNNNYTKLLVHERQTSHLSERICVWKNVRYYWRLRPRTSYITFDDDGK